MKTLPALLSAAAIAAVFYLGYSVDQAAKRTTDRLDKIISNLPATSGKIAQEGSKGFWGQTKREAVSAPTDMLKIAASNIAETGKKAGRDTAAEAKRAPQNVSTFINRASGGIFRPHW
jgi:hypothetical protein